MSRIPRNDRWLSVLARLADPPGRAEPQPSQPSGQGLSWLSGRAATASPHGSPSVWQRPRA
jgi:hypothetical protein